MYWAMRIWMLAMELALLPLGGWWLDRQFGTTPWLLLAGVVLGLVIATLDFSQLAKGRGGPPKSRSSRKKD
ncbi:MAG: AtpZ/AtpI family protein [Planctomycetes bacterium]|nr:AtpZ/AtpI family protein [Planctomycetota bacterium]